MSRPIIEVKNLSKVYQLGTIGATRLKDEVALLWDRARGRHKAQKKGEFRALHDLSFDVQPGEVVGIIGRNGAGKSTLLKILSRITQQTAGEITLRGRVASLLEVGTGFHPDLTGRENIFLNGAILGMTRAEIRRKLDEIIAFAEVEQFIDTPVKRYSSGMYVRLAFAVAAHLEPEILIVDEVLAVGDFAFQNKCLGKMGEVSKKEGRTILFVSHNMAVLRALCSRAILLDAGQKRMDGAAAGVVQAYLEGSAHGEATLAWEPNDAPQADGFLFRRVSITNQKGCTAPVVMHNEPFAVRIEYEVKKIFPGLRIGFLIQNSEGVEICGSNDVGSTPWDGRTPGVYVSECRMPSYLLNEGIYHVKFGADAPHGTLDLLTPFCVEFSVQDTERHGETKHRLPGVLRPKVSWEVGKAPDEGCAPPLSGQAGRESE
jgi:lipopolysaccharide transport system ATP-binding protein